MFDINNYLETLDCPNYQEKNKILLSEWETISAPVVQRGVQNQ